MSTKTKAKTAPKSKLFKVGMDFNGRMSIENMQIFEDSYSQYVAKKAKNLEKWVSKQTYAIHLFETIVIPNL